MPDPSQRRKLNDTELVEYAQHLAVNNERSLRRVKEDAIRDAVVYEDRGTGERRTLPKKFINALGAPATFELVDPDLIPGAPISTNHVV